MTTGDESGAADLLAQKLKDLKNKCRSNRANGLIPQAEMEKAELENKLTELRTVQDQQWRVLARQQQLQRLTVSKFSTQQMQLKRLTSL